MKKFLSIMLALVMVLSMSTVAFAAEGDDDSSSSTPTTWTDMTTVTLTKEYKLTNPATTSPAETFSFSALACTGVTDAGVGSNGSVVTASTAPVPTIASVNFVAGAAGDATNGKQTVTITLPSYDAVGVYTYTFTETDGGTAGVTYRNDAIKLVVTVIEQSGKVRVAAVHTEGDAEGAQKSDTFDNTYSAGSLSVKKKVTGDFGDKKKEFTVKVTFTAPTGDTVREAISYVDGTETKTIEADESGWTGSKEVEITLKDAETVTFTNIPYGVTYTVEENDYTSEGYDPASYDNNKTGTINAASVTTEITNNKGGTVNTGIDLDSMPYVLMLAVACVGMFLFVSKKRMMREN